MYRRSPLFQRSFRIMLNNGTNAIVSAERDHVQIMMIRRYREPPTRTPCSLVSAPICMNSCFRAVSFLVFTAAYFSFSPALPFPSPPLSLLFVHSNLLKDYLFVIHRNCDNLNNCFSMMNISFFILSQHFARL